MTPYEIIDIAFKLAPKGIPADAEIDMAIMLLVKAQRALNKYEDEFRFCGAGKKE